MRPDLFKAVLTEVPFVDVINTMFDSSIPWTAFEFEVCFSLTFVSIFVEFFHAFFVQSATADITVA